MRIVQYHTHGNPEQVLRVNQVAPSKRARKGGAVLLTADPVQIPSRRISR